MPQNNLGDREKSGLDFGLVISIIIVLSAVVIPGSLFVPRPIGGSDIAFAIMYQPIIMLGIGLAFINIVLLIRAFVRRSIHGSGWKLLAVLLLTALLMYPAVVYWKYYQ